MGIVKRHRLPRKQKKKANSILASIFGVKVKELKRYLKSVSVMPITVSNVNHNLMDEMIHAEKQICFAYGLPAECFKPNNRDCIGAMEHQVK